ncbi:MAG TPA: dicarboxylate/amino acid:cation symporter [Candidatus Binatia bacterium]|nr:dicarboxylate/amino acid:cation symporter [Candidatus Binatia bacterium]
MRVTRLWFGIPLWVRILAGLVAGAITGFAVGPEIASITWMGEVFVRLIRMLVAPLVFILLASGVAAMGDVKQLGAVGWKTIALYVLTTFVAVWIGLGVGTALQPGLGVELVGVTAREIATPRPASEILINIIPLNPVQAIAAGDTLAIIFFAILVGVGCLVAGEQGKPLANVLASASEVMLRIVGIVMETAPFGVFALIAVVTGTQGAATFVNIAQLALCVVIGATAQTLLTHGFLVRVLAWLPLIPFYRGVADAIMVGFSTSSSSATLPVAIRVAEENLGIKPTISSTVLPLGATIGMDGTAMYIALLTMFSVQAFGVELQPMQYLIIAGMTTIVAMGVAPVPSGSLFVFAAVLGAIGIPVEQAALIVGLILPFDRPLDMMRTVPNVTCDLAVATVVARSEGEIDVAEYRSAKDI